MRFDTLTYIHKTNIHPHFLYLNTQPKYILYRAPAKAINMLENTKRRFFRGYKDEERGMVWFGWKKIYFHSKKEDWVLVVLRQKISRSLAKWWWRLYSDSGAFWCLWQISHFRKIFLRRSNHLFCFGY